MDKKERFCMAYEYLRSIGKIHTQEDLAMVMKASRSNVSSALAGRKKVLTDNFIQRFAASFPGMFNLDWLLYGEGEMLKGAESPQESLTASMVSDTTPYGETSRDAIIMRLMDKIDEKDAKIEALQNEVAELRAELAMAGLLTKKHG